MQEYFTKYYYGNEFFIISCFLNPNNKLRYFDQSDEKYHMNNIKACLIREYNVIVEAENLAHVTNDDAEGSDLEEVPSSVPSSSQSTLPVSDDDDYDDNTDLSISQMLNNSDSDLDISHLSDDTLMDLDTDTDCTFDDMSTNSTPR